MPDAEISARLIVLETFVMMTLGLYLANSRNDPDYSKANALLDHMKATVSQNALALPPEAQMASRQYADRLCDMVSQNLRALHGEGGATH